MNLELDSSKLSRSTDYYSSIISSSNLSDDYPFINEYYYLSNMYYISTFRLTEDYEIVITYFKEDADQLSYINDFGTSYTDMPYTDGLVSINDLVLIDESTSTYQVEFLDGMNTNRFQISFPEEIDPQYIVSKNMYLSLLSGSRTLFLKVDDDHVYEFNLNSLDYNSYRTLNIVGYTSKGSNNTALLTIFLPKTTDYLLSIDLQFKYRSERLFAGYEDWHSVRKTYTYFEEDNDGWFSDNLSMTEINPPDWICILNLFGIANILDGLDLFNQQTIQEMSFSDIDPEIKSKFTDYFANSLDDFNDFSFWQINLGQIDSGWYNYDIGFDIQDLVIIEVIYQDNGDLFIADQESIHQDISNYLNDKTSLVDVFTTIETRVTNATTSLFKDVAIAVMSVFGFLFLIKFLWKKLISKDNKKHKTKLKKRYGYRR
jgi:hypothetical protein